MERFSHRELRFLASPTQAGALLQAAGRHMHLAVYDPERPLAYARTLYLAGSGLTPGSERRLRIRQYAAAASAEQSPHVTSTYLEYKQRDGEQRDKVRLAVPASAMLEMLAGQLSDAWRARLGAIPELREVVPGLARGALEPRLLTWYRRVSLAGAGLRVTLDDGVAFGPPELPADDGGLAAPVEVTAMVRGIIIEIKASAELPSWLGDRVAGLPAAPSSKFDAGMAALEAARPSFRTRRQVA